MSQNGAFNGAPPWRPEAVRRRPREAALGDFPPADRAEVEECRRVAGQERDAGSLVLVWEAMGWDPELMLWATPESLLQRVEYLEDCIALTPAEQALMNWLRMAEVA